jgi:protein tyrosine phosphatase (PTP) superfamily phosphohydrolase (DUF442 family)
MIWFPRTLKVRVIAAVLVLACGTAGAAIWYDRYYPYHHFRTVQKSAFYRSSQPSPHDLERAVDGYGIKLVVNLRDVVDRTYGDWYTKETDAAAKLGVRLVDIPCRGMYPPSPDQVEELLRLWDDPANRPILVHCANGTLRSAAAEGLWRMEYMGESGSEALGHVTTWGRDLHDDAPKIEDFIKNYVPRRARSHPP